MDKIRIHGYRARGQVFLYVRGTKKCRTCVQWISLLERFGGYAIQLLDEAQMTANFDRSRFES